MSLALLLGTLLACGGDGADMAAEPPPNWTERVAAPRRQIGSEQPPLLVMLHGIGADENDLFPIAGMLDPRFKIVSLRAPETYATGYAWFHIDFHPDGTLTPHGDEARATLRALVRWVETAPERHGTDASRTFLLGFSQGAMMSLGVLRTAPQLLAGVVVLSGRSPDAMFDMQADTAALKSVPLLVAHGQYDDVIPVASGRALRDGFGTAFENFTYQEFPVAHGVSAEEVAFVAGWLRDRLDARPPS